jgi:hypothetical protein
VKGLYGCQGSVEKAPDLVDIWIHALVTYSHTRLTEPNKDKLIALHGISQRIADFLGDNLWHGFLSSGLPYSLRWYASCRNHCNFDEAPEDNAFASWQIVRSNHQWSFVEHHPGEDPLLRIVDGPANSSRLCCIGRIVPLQLQLEASHVPCQRPPHMLTIFGFAAESDGRRVTGFYRATMGCSNYSDPFNAHLDHTVDLADGKLSWLLLPVCWETHQWRWRPEGIPYEEALSTAMPHLTTGLTRFSALILQPNANGDLVRVGLLHNEEYLSNANFLVLLKAVQKAKPRFLMIS